MKKDNSPISNKIKTIQKECGAAIPIPPTKQQMTPDKGTSTAINSEKKLSNSKETSKKFVQFGKSGETSSF